MSHFLEIPTLSIFEQFLYEQNFIYKVCIGGLPSNAKQNAISYMHNYLVNEVYIAICDCYVMVWYVMEINTRSSNLVVYFKCVTFAYKASSSLTQRYKVAKSPRGWRFLADFATFVIWLVRHFVFDTWMVVFIWHYIYLSMMACCQTNTDVWKHKGW